MRRALPCIILAFSLPAHAVTIDWAIVGDPGNAADLHCGSARCGSVPYAYYISRYEVTNSQYAEFLNAKAKSDPLGLFYPENLSDPAFRGIIRSGGLGRYTYTVKAGFENKPVNYVDFYDALRFANWLHNGQGGGDTETGAYTLLGGTAKPSNAVTLARNPSAIAFLTSANEWYKAAYYSPGGTYFDYPTGTDQVTWCSVPALDGGNSANCGNVVGALTDVGAYGLSESPYGTFDQGGNVAEWNDDAVPVTEDRFLRGGYYFDGPDQFVARAGDTVSPIYSSRDIGFRVGYVVPEPGTAVLLITGLQGLAAWRRHRSA